MTPVNEHPAVISGTDDKSRHGERQNDPGAGIGLFLLAVTISILALIILADLLSVFVR